MLTVNIFTVFCIITHMTFKPLVFEIVALPNLMFPFRKRNVLSGENNGNMGIRTEF